LPAPDKVDANVSDYANASGFTAVIMKDLQRVFACLHFEGEPKDGGANSDSDSAFLSEVANGKITFSSKITLAMSSQPSWRT